jgi:hypothetical protein
LDDFNNEFPWHKIVAMNSWQRFLQRIPLEENRCDELMATTLKTNFFDFMILYATILCQGNSFLKSFPLIHGNDFLLKEFVVKSST